MAMASRPKANIWHKHTKFDVPEIFQGCEILECVTWPWPRPLRDNVGRLKLIVLLVAKPCTKFEVCSFIRSEDSSWSVKFKLVTWPWLRHFQGRFVADKLGHAMINLPAKFEVLTSPVTEISKALQNVENGVVRGHPSLSAMSLFDRYRALHFLFVFNRNYTSILYRLWGITFDRSTVAVFCYTSCV